MTDEEKEALAYHEAGHALAHLLLPEAEPLHKVTIIPRGRALGATMFLPERDRYIWGQRRLQTEITTLYAGRIAEKMCTGDLSTGAADDIKRATELAARSDRPDRGPGIRLTPLSPSIADDTIRYSSVHVELDRAARVARLTVSGPDGPQPATPDEIFAEADRYWPLRAFRDLDDALLRLRFNEPAIGTIVVKTAGDAAQVLERCRQVVKKADAAAFKGTCLVPGDARVAQATEDDPDADVESILMSYYGECRSLKLNTMKVTGGRTRGDWAELTVEGSGEYGKLTGSVFLRKAGGGWRFHHDRLSEVF